MGNAFATSGGLFIHTDKPSYFPGELVTGKVFMNVAHHMTSREVKLTIRGRERVQWTDPTQQQQVHHHGAAPPSTTAGHHSPTVPGQPGYVQNQHAKPHWGSKEFFKVTQSLPQLSGHLNAGQYEVPFSFQLPHGLPASVDLRGTAVGTSRFAAVIGYTIKASCDVANAADFSHKSKLVIGNCQPAHRGPVNQTKEEKVKRMGLMSLGKVHTTVHVPRTEMVAGETLAIKVEVKNDSSADIQKAKLRLWRKIEIHDAGFGMRRIEQKAASVEGHKIGAKQNKTGEHALNLNLTLPHDLPPETKGSLVSVTYKLVLSMDISMASDPSIEIPVSIFQPQHHHWQQPHAHQLPPGWNPHVLAPVGFGAFAVSGLPPAPVGSPILHHPGQPSGPAPPSFTPGYTPAAPPQGGFPPAGSPHGHQAGYPPAGAPPAGYPPAGAPPSTRDAGYPPAGAPPAGYPPAGAPPTGYPPAGAPPAGYPPAGSPPAGYPPAGSPPGAGYPGAAPPSYSPAHTPSAPPPQAGYPPAAGYPAPGAPVGYPGAPPHHGHDHHAQPQYTQPGAGAPPSSAAPGVYPPAPGVQADHHHGHHGHH